MRSKRATLITGNQDRLDQETVHGHYQMCKGRNKCNAGSNLCHFISNTEHWTNSHFIQLILIRASLERKILSRIKKLWLLPIQYPKVIQEKCWGGPTSTCPVFYRPTDDYRAHSMETQHIQQQVAGPVSKPEPNSFKGYLSGPPNHGQHKGISE